MDQSQKSNLKAAPATPKARVPNFGIASQISHGLREAAAPPSKVTGYSTPRYTGGHEQYARVLFPDAAHNLAATKGSYGAKDAG